MLADLGGREFPSEQVWEVGGHMDNRLHQDTDWHDWKHYLPINYMCGW